MPGQPTEEPPIGVSSELLWRLAVRLFEEHACAGAPAGAASSGPAPGGSAPTRHTATCARCRQPWPCSGRRLAELGLKSAGF